MHNFDIENLYKEYFKIVYKYLICLTKNKEIAEDLSQETFCKAIKKIDTFRGECKISVWLCEIAKNLWINESKKSSKILLLDDKKDIMDVAYNIEEEIFFNEEKIELYKRINKLDEYTKEIIYLKLLGNLSFREIGQIMGKSEVWARVNFYRGKQKIKEEKRNEKRL